MYLKRMTNAQFWRKKYTKNYKKENNVNPSGKAKAMSFKTSNQDHSMNDENDEAFILR